MLFPLGKKSVKLHNSGTILFVSCRQMKTEGGRKEDLEKHQQNLMRRSLPKKKQIPGVKHVVLVASGKGGVGKSTTSVNLAAALSRLQLKVGVLDADVFGPSIPTMLRVSEQPLLDKSNKMLPVMNHGLSCMSMGLLVEPGQAIVWRGPMVMGAVNKLLFETNWSGTDILIVDLPPGTGDVHLSVSQTVAVSGAVVVSTAQKVALEDVRKGVDMFHKVAIPVLGVVQNMSSFLCPSCGTSSSIFGKRGALQLAEELGVVSLGDVPLDPLMVQACDQGTPLVLSHPQSTVTQVYMDIAQKLKKILGL